MTQFENNFLKENSDSLENIFHLSSAEKTSQGSFGVTYIFKNKCIKLTFDEKDAINCFNISKHKNENIINIKNVYKKYINEKVIYIIISEKALMLNRTEKNKIITFLNCKLNFKNKKLNDIYAVDFFNKYKKEIENNIKEGIEDAYLFSLINWGVFSDNFFIDISVILNSKKEIIDLLNCYNSLKSIGFIHSDIHRYNIMKNSLGKICLIDYGIGISEFKDDNIPELIA